MTTNNPILGLGNDIIEIERIRLSLITHPEKFIARILTEREQEYCAKHSDPAPHLAGRFAAKEAVAKALGTGFGQHLSWQDIEILNNADGKPEVFLSPHARQTFNNPQLLISLSHCREYASAVAIHMRS